MLKMDDENKYKIDLIFSIGIACRPAYHLQRVGFRQFASPLDWQRDYSLDTIIHLFKTSFADFFTEIREDLEYPGFHRRVFDTKNNICSVHHFERMVDIYENQEEFQKMMKNRFFRLDQAICKSSTIAIICNREEQEDSFVKFLKEFALLYPEKKITLINIYDKKIEGRIKSVLSINDFLEVHSYTFDDKSTDLTRWQGDHENWNWVLRHYYLRKKADIEQCKNYLLDNKNIVIYGAGKMSHKVIEYLRLNDINISGIVVSDMNGNPSELMGLKVKSVDEYDLRECVCIISIENEEIREELIKNLDEKKIYKIGYFYKKFESVKFVGD